LEINTISDCQSSVLVREQATISSESDPDQEHAISLAVLFDSGCSSNCISDEMFNSLLDASPCPIPFSEQVTEITFGLNTSTGFASLKKVTLHVRLTLADIPLQLLLPVWVVKDLSEQFTIGLPTLRQYGLLSYMEDPEAWRLSRVAISPEELAEDELHRDEIQFNPPSNDPTPSIPIDDTLLQLGPSFTLVPELLSIISEYHYQFAPLTVSDHLKVPPMRIELRDNAHLLTNQRAELLSS
jgi:hypothetical protein